MTGAELATYIKSVFKRTDKDTQLFESITDTILDMKLRYMHDRFKVEAYSTSLSTLKDYKIDLPSDFGHLIGKVRCYEVSNASNDRILVKRTKSDFDELYPNPNASDVSTGMPQDFCIFGGQILVGPPVDSTGYAIEFSYTTEAVENIVTGTTNVPFSDRHRECLREGSLARLYALVDNPERSIYYENKYEISLQKIIDNDKKNTDAIQFIRYNGF
jgi:hypothetical protein